MITVRFIDLEGYFDIYPGLFHKDSTENDKIIKEIFVMGRELTWKTIKEKTNKSYYLNLEPTPQPTEPAGSWTGVKMQHMLQLGEKAKQYIIDNDNNINKNKDCLARLDFGIRTKMNLWLDELHDRRTYIVTAWRRDIAIRVNLLRILNMLNKDRYDFIMLPGRLDLVNHLRQPWVNVDDMYLIQEIFFEVQRIWFHGERTRAIKEVRQELIELFNNCKYFELASPYKVTFVANQYKFQSKKVEDMYGWKYTMEDRNNTTKLGLHSNLNMIPWMKSFKGLNIAAQEITPWFCPLSFDKAPLLPDKPKWVDMYTARIMKKEKRIEDDWKEHFKHNNETKYLDNFTRGVRAINYLEGARYMGATHVPQIETEDYASDGTDMSSVTENNEEDEEEAIEDEMDE